jgi:hypothetical protein
MSASNASTLLQHWARSSVSLRPPVTRKEIEAFEQRYSIKLPDEIRDYYLAADGFAAPNDQDENGFCFWPLTRVCPVASYENGRLSTEDTKDCFLFADYLSECWSYAFCVGSRSLNVGVCIVGTADGRPIWIAQGFSEFVELYVRDDERLYPGRADVVDS